MNIDTFDLNLLRMFHAMMEERNVTRAAQRVHLSQPAASHALARLRKQLGDPLFVRAGRVMIPTAKAAELGPAVNEMLRHLAPALGHASFDPNVSEATFRIGMIDFVEYLLSPLFSRLIRKDGPHLRVMVHAPDPGSVESQLAGGELDMAIGIFDPQTAGIHARRLADQPMVGVVRKGHPLAKSNATPQQFRNTPRLSTTTHHNGAESLLDKQLARAGIAGDVVYVTQNFFSVPLLLKTTDLLLVTGAGVAQLLCSQHPLAQIPLPVQLPPLQAHLIWHERTHYDPAQKWMRDTLMEVALRPRPAVVAQAA
jgi:DNA-binding transcriptional LysR family regulator